MKRIIITTFFGIVAIVIIAPICSGIISDLAKSGTRFTWLSQMVSILLVPVFAGYYGRCFGAAVGFVLALSLIGSILVVWIMLLNASYRDLLNNFDHE